MAVKGAVLGDVLGSQYEFDKPKNLDWKHIPLVDKDNTGIGFTDDSVMTLAIKKALVQDSDLVDAMVEVERKYPHCGYVSNFYYWINGDKHEPYNSWGNGSDMKAWRTNWTICFRKWVI